jgi:hypothetical protein
MHRLDEPRRSWLNPEGGSEVELKKRWVNMTALSTAVRPVIRCATSKMATSSPVNYLSLLDSQSSQPTGSLAGVPA